jgi:serine phosphatase RsbU (regulator of sigma subunit)/anti-sigma regulatory factor (Ser/Thr protein kinase)
VTALSSRSGIHSKDNDSPHGLLSSIDELRRLQSVTDAALQHLTVDALMDELLDRVRDALAADTAAILLIDPTGSDLVARAAKGLEEEVRQGVRIPLGKGFAGTVAATGVPIAIEEVNESNVLNPILQQTGIRSLLGVPLVVNKKTLGVLHVGTLKKRRFTGEDTSFLQLVADRVALALHAALYERERAAGQSLQRSLLPERPPLIPGLDVAVRYFPASGGDVGGDWYDVFILPDGSIGLAIGDVVGRGLPASSTMAKVRNALRAYALESTPGEVLRRLERFMWHLNPGEMATVLYGVLDPVRLELTFANAGHMPPFVVEQHGQARLLEIARDPPLGTANGTSFTEHQQHLGDGASLILYTDGLIERRSESLEAGFDRLLQALQRDLPAEALSDRIVSLLLEGDEVGDDDVAFLVARVMEPEDRFEVALPAEGGKLVILRRLMERWLISKGVDHHLIYDALAASGEAAANAIEHAYGPNSGSFTVSADIVGGRLNVQIRDGGGWRLPRGRDRGRGLPLMKGLVDEMKVTPSAGGTSVELVWDL